MKSNPLIIIQARMSSTRFPGKILMDFYYGKSLLDIQLATLKQLQLPIVLATSRNKNDDALEKWAEQNGIPCFRGDENNVLQRFIGCAKAFEAEQIIRVCSDNPFLQFKGIELLVEGLEEGYDYISYADKGYTPAIKKHWGLFAEGVNLLALKNAQELLQKNNQSEFYQEHVTNFIYGNPNLFKIKLIKAPSEIVTRNDLRFTIDTPEDFENMNHLLELVNGKHQLQLDKLLTVVDENPKIKETMLKGIAKFNK